MALASDNALDVIDFVVNKANGVKGLSDTSLKTVPVHYIQPGQERRESFTLSQETIPVIDVTHWNDPSVAAAKIAPARRYGFFQIINQGSMIWFFEEVAAEEKMKYKTQGGVGRDVVRDEALEYYKKSEATIHNIARVLIEGLGAKGKEAEDKASFIVKAGVGRHSDVSALTVLLQDDVGGLYVKSPEGDAWIHVTPTKGVLVINIGDAFQIVSNGQYTSIEHRVITNSNENRVSVAPLPDETIGPLSKVLETGESPVYREIVYSDYCKHYFGRSLDGKNAIDWAKL
ncbi:Feruloyl CoA ortho-hydroxylase F6H1-3-like protein [Drosera capensis]